MRTDISYALVTLGSTTLWSVLSGWLLYFYLPPEGTPLVPATFYSVVMFIISAVHAGIDPPIGYLSDHARSRWGRRLPFMFASALPMVLLFVLLWTPPVRAESTWNLVYLGTMMLLYKTASSTHQIPYRALLPELALTDHHRTRMAAWYASFQLIGMILGGLAGLIIENRGYVTAALIYASATLAFLYLPFLVLHEQPGREIAVAERLNFWQSISTTLHNRAFLVYTATWALYWSTTTFVQAAIPFIVTEVCLLTRADAMYFYIPAVLASLACYPLITWLSAQVGKWRTFSGSLLASAIVLPGLMLIGDWLPVPLLAQGIIWVTLEAIAMSGAVMLSATFTAEITDRDEMLTGQRREGTYYATWGLLGHIVNGAAAALLPLLLLLGRSRSDLYGPMGVRMVGVVGGVMMLVAFLIFLRYPLRHRQDGQQER
ncbi:MAG: MFS transporter [Chloroflexota bacterium]|nr:MFS transporter [Chloroflexota bacterium]